MKVNSTVIRTGSLRLRAEIARLRGALRAVKHVAKMNLSFTPEHMLK